MTSTENPIILDQNLAPIIDRFDPNLVSCLLDSKTGNLEIVSSWQILDSVAIKTTGNSNVSSRIARGLKLRSLVFPEGQKFLFNDEQDNSIGILTTTIPEIIECSCHIKHIGKNATKFLADYYDLAKI